MCKGAWEVKNKWTDKYISKFQEQLNNKLRELNTSDETFTCDDLALETIIDFASANKLPFKWVTGSGTFDASDSKYSNEKEFLNDVKKHSGAPDFANNANTIKIGISNVQTGSLNVLTAIGKSAPNHIQVISSVFNDNKSVVEKGYLGITGFIAAQGNFRLPVWLWNRYTSSGNPEAFNYLGVHMQAGIYDATRNIWVSPETGTTENFLGGHYSNEYRNYNFLNWNK